MKKFVRFAGVALLALTISVASCGGDDDPVTPVAPPAPTTPPPPPPSVVVTMSPASQTIGVGGTVAFAVSVSGGVAGEAASWTCASSDPSKATVTMTSAGCAATAVAVGGVTITAVVTKSGATVNTAAGLTITEDTVERASLFIASIKDSNSDTDADDELLSERVRVMLDVERGDQVLMQLSVLVDGVVAVSRTYGGGASVVAAAPEGEEGERAAQQAARAVELSFNSAAYDTDTGVPKYLNGERTISAELTVVGSDEPLKSGGHPHEFGNGDGVHALVSFQGDPLVNPTTGQGWYGGPDAGITVTGRLVSYSGDMVGSLTLLEVCGNKPIMDSEAPFVFDEMECKSTRALTEDDKIFRIAERDVGILNHKEVFPLRLDYEGPEAPVFKVNPNSRQGGWINKAVNLTGKNGPGAAKNGWLIYGGKGGGVGGYIPQLRYSTSDPRSVAAARAATPSTELPSETTSASKICFIVTAKDLLGNESALPAASKGCIPAGSEGKLDTTDDTKVDALNPGSDYGALVTELKAALNQLAAASSDAAEERVADARKALRDVGLQGGVDITPPTAGFTRTSLGKDSRTGEEARMIGATDEFKLTVDDAGSGIHTTKAVVAELMVRDADGTKCVRSNKVTGSVSQCGDPFMGFTYDAADDLVTTNVFSANANVSPALPALDETGYHTFTARAQDKAGNLSEENSNVALRDTDYAARADVRVTSGSSSNPLGYTLAVNVNDDLSIRDYYVAMTLGGASGAAIGAIQLADEHVIALDDIVQVDAYNASDLTPDLDVSEKVTLPFLGLQQSSEAIVPIAMMRVYARDQGGEAVYAEDQSDARVEPLALYVPSTDRILAASGDGLAPGIGLMVAYDVANTDGGVDAPFGDDDDDITLMATATAATVDDLNTEVVENTANPFKRVLFYASSSGGWRHIGSALKNDAAALVYTFKTDAGEIADIMDDEDGETYSGTIIAIGIKDDREAEIAVPAVGEEGDTGAAAVTKQTGKVGLVSSNLVDIRIQL